MKRMHLLQPVLLLAILCCSLNVFSQVKIGGLPAELPHASAVLELKATDKGFLLPRLTQQQMTDIISPADALVVYNTDAKTVFVYNQLLGAWRPLATDSAEWKYDPVNSKVYLTRGYPQGDSIFYDVSLQKFVFADKITNTNSIGQVFPVTDFSGKYYFKSTASRFRDPDRINPSSVNVIFEVDSTGFHQAFRGMQIATVNNQKNLEKLQSMGSLSMSTIHAGTDSVLSLTGMLNSTSINGTGGTLSMTGFTNSVNINDAATRNVVTVAGMRNAINNISQVSHVTGNVYGYFGSAFLLDDLGNPTIDGNFYGVFLSNFFGAAPRKTFAFYSNRGINRFGDSVVISDNNAILPRAVLDINSSSAMIIPTGLTSSRPVVPVTGMFRYNTNTQSVEVYSGTAWNGTLRGSFGIDLAIMNPATGTTITALNVTGAVAGNVVVVSPANALPGGIVIAWARVSATNQVEIRFENNNGTAVDPPLNTYDVRVIQ